MLNTPSEVRGFDHRGKEILQPVVEDKERAGTHRADGEQIVGQVITGGDSCGCTDPSAASRTRS